MENSTLFHELSRQTDANNAVLRQILQKLAGSGTEGAEQCLDLLKPTTKSLQERDVTELKNKFLHFPVPPLNLESAYSVAEMYKRLQFERDKLKELDKTFLTFEFVKRLIF